MVDYHLGANCNLFERFSTGDSVTEEGPFGPVQTNLLGTFAFILAVVPFGQIGFYARHRAQAGEFASASRALPRTAG